MTELAKTRGSYLKELLKELAASAERRSSYVADDTRTRTAWTFGYQQALDDIFDKMEVHKE